MNAALYLGSFTAKPSPAKAPAQQLCIRAHASTDERSAVLGLLRSKAEPRKGGACAAAPSVWALAGSTAGSPAAKPSPAEALPAQRQPSSCGHLLVAPQLRRCRAGRSKGSACAGKPAAGTAAAGACGACCGLALLGSHCMGPRTAGKLCSRRNPVAVACGLPRSVTVRRCSSQLAKWHMCAIWMRLVQLSALGLARHAMPAQGPSQSRGAPDAWCPGVNVMHSGFGAHLGQRRARAPVRAPAAAAPAQPPPLPPCWRRGPGLRASCPAGTPAHTPVLVSRGLRQPRRLLNVAMPEPRALTVPAELPPELPCCRGLLRPSRPGSTQAAGE